MKTKTFAWNKLKAVFTLGWATFFSALALHAQLSSEDFSAFEFKEKLNLTDLQVVQLKAIQSETDAQLAQLKKQIEEADGRKERMELSGQLRELPKAQISQVQAVLTVEQFEIFEKELALTRDKKSLEYLASLKERLNLSNEQTLEMEAVMAVYQPQIQELMDELGEANGFMTKRKIGSKLSDLREELDDSVKTILDGAQYAEWQVMSEERRAEMRAQFGRG